MAWLDFDDWREGAEPEYRVVLRGLHAIYPKTVAVPYTLLSDRRGPSRL
jgi:hypothetical protein